MHFSPISLICCLLVCGAFSSSPCQPGYEALGSDSSCVPCEPGFFDTGYGYCESCNPNTFQPEAGQLDCLSCPPNTTSNSGASECISCPEGQAMMETNECGTCPPGEYMEMGGFCYSCPTGFFKAETGVHPCTPCPRNGYSRPGASECTLCPEGEAPMSDGSCRTCPPGKYYDTYNFECVDCDPGSYTDIENVLQNCYSCGGNSFSREGASACFECPAGKVFIESSHTCEKCEPGYFYDQYSLSCVQCYHNQFSVYDSQLECISCMSGSFARRGSTTCFPCPLRQVYLAETDECGTCPPNLEYDYHLAKCDYVYGYYDMFPPEQFEELNASSEPLFELLMDSGEEQPRVTDDPSWELGLESEYKH